MNTAAKSPAHDADVLIVGAGPTGLTLGLALRRAGLSAIVIDQLEAGQNTSRAAVIHAHTLEVLDGLGVADRLDRAGLKLTRFSLLDRDRPLLGLRFDELPSPHAHLLMLTQDVTERILRERLAESGMGIRWGCKLESLRQDATGVVARVQSRTGTETLRTRYVVGADGMHSLVRHAAGIGFAGESYEDSFVLADVDMEWEHGRDEVKLFFSPSGLLVVAPLPNGGFRLVGPLDGAPERPGVAEMQALLDARGPVRGGARVTQVRWSSRFRLHHRVADAYRQGRMFLAGDAAHAHSPAGGQGMNTGIVDAVVLGQVLADVLQGRRNETHLDEYQRLRRPAAEKVLGLAGRLTAMATVKGATRRRVRNALLRTVGRLPAFRRNLQMQLSGLARRDSAPRSAQG
jgi:2-polyprenyl-6-methoxyphenol hydroxylase-like FAD-dependent oxidoreductase